MALLLFVAPSARADLGAVGPVDPATGYPAWYEDQSGTRLLLCTDLPLSPVSDPCLLDGELPNPGLPLSLPGNFPDELFYWMADATVGTPAGMAQLVLAIEAAFAGAGNVQPGLQITFNRLRIRVDIPALGFVPGAEYVVTHPYGTVSFFPTVSGNRAINFTLDMGGFLPGEFTTTLLGPVMGSFLAWDTPVSTLPGGFLGDPLIPHTVTGSPLGTNFFRVVGPNLDVQTDLFSVLGKLDEPAFVPPEVKVRPRRAIWRAVKANLRVKGKVVPLEPLDGHLSTVDLYAPGTVNAAGTGCDGTFVAQLQTEASADGKPKFLFVSNPGDFPTNPGWICMAPDNGKPRQRVVTAF